MSKLSDQRLKKMEIETSIAILMVWFATLIIGTMHAREQDMYHRAIEESIGVICARDNAASRLLSPSTWMTHKCEPK